MQFNPIIIPLVHLNGQSKAGLIEEHMRIHEALRAAYEAMKNNAPHPRDYYHTENWETVSAEWKERISTVYNLLATFENEAVALDRGDLTVEVRPLKSYSI